MNFSLIQTVDLTKNAYIPVGLASTGRPTTIEQAKQEKADSEVAYVVNDRLEVGEQWLSWVAAKDQSAEDLNKQPGEVAVVGAKYKATTVDAVVRFQKNDRGIEQPISSAELVLNNVLALRFEQSDPSYSGSTSISLPANSNVGGFLIHGAVGKPATVERTPKQ
jgi:hypothetical protein